MRKNIEELIQGRIRYLREETDFALTIFEGLIGYAVIAADFDGNILAYNEGAHIIYGYAPEEIIGKQHIEIFFPKDFIEAGKLQRIIDNLLGKDRCFYEGENVRKTGDRFPARVLFTLTKNNNGKVVGFVEIVEDLTERKRAEQTLQHASRMKSKFLAYMSHELRTPLNAIIGFSEFLFDEKAGALNDRQKDYLNDILNSGRHLLQLINEVLDLSKIEAGKMELHVKRFSLPHAVAEVHAALQPLADQKHIAISVDIASELREVHLDPGRFKQVLSNLLSNAVKFTGAGGRVEIRAARCNRHQFQVCVQDTGIGIKPEDMRRLFVEFQQLDSGADRNYQGTGLGLALTKKFVEMQGGSICVESAVGQGSVFTVVLPLSAEGKP